MSRAQGRDDAVTAARDGNICRSSGRMRAMAAPSELERRRSFSERIFGARTNIELSGVVSVSRARRQVHGWRAAGYNGYYPEAGVTELNGTLYGTTEFGGTFCGSIGCGTVFSLTTSRVKCILYNFKHGQGGDFPMAGLTLLRMPIPHALQRFNCDCSNGACRFSGGMI
jgi:uncharacterized repeat protein (TIGR03803 family)